MPVKQINGNFIEDFDMYMRTVKRFKPRTIVGHINRLKCVMMLAVFRGIIPFSPFKGYSPQKPEFKQMYLTEEELAKFANMTYDTPNRNFTKPCKSRGWKPVDSYRTAENRNAGMCKADGDTARHLEEI